MAKFKFHLDSLKKFREHRVLMARKEMLQVQSKVMAIEVGIQEAKESISLCLTEGKQTFAYLGLISNQKEKIARLENDLSMANRDLEKHKSWVAHLSRELKAVEKLEEKKRELFEENEKQKEKRLSDAWVAERWSRSESKIGEEAS